MYVLGLDVGEKRIGIALANSIAQLPSPHGVIANDAEAIANIKELATKNKAEAIVVGLPRNMSGEETAQSKHARAFAESLEEAGLPVSLADESLSTKRAQDMSGDSKTRKKGEPIDDLAACFILEEFFKGEVQR